MKRIEFSEDEMKVLGERPGMWEDEPPIRVYNRPISSGENFRLLYREKHPVWLPNTMETKDFCPKLIPDNIARAFVLSDEPFDNATESGGPDMFGVVWEYEPLSMGSMVRPGNPMLEDVNDWKSVIQFPDVDSWDWQGAAENNKEYLSGGEWINFWLLSGAWFERLISFMDFENAAVALIDETQQEAVHELFEATTDVMCKIVDKVAEYFPQVNGIYVHDDWGGQNSPFFSMDTAMEMIVPHMKKLVDHIHDKGFVAELHSCGHTEGRIEAYIAAGWDAWHPQEMNDTETLYEKYGDKITLYVYPKDWPENPTEEQEQELAKDFVMKYCQPGKIAMPSLMIPMTKAFEETLYRQSRKCFLEQE